MNANFSSASAPGRALFFILAFVAGAAPGRADSRAPLAPPHYPDAVHVFNGCHLSTLTYLTRFTAEFSGEQGRPLVVQMMNADGRVRSHTMALVTWHGTWWVRDEYFGVFSLECSPATVTDPARLTAQAERCYARHVAGAVRESGTARPPEPPAHFSAELRAHDVATASAAFPLAHIVYWVKDGSKEIPLIFFRPAPGVIAVYDPAHGTGVTNCASRNSARITSLLAAQLGYRVEDIRADFAADTAALFTAAAFAR